ncbi:hypothetical protein FB107DRAFT_245984 [Schizophyllum commune]
MNNLLRTLRERERQNGYSNTDLKRVLADVKAERKANDSGKLTDPFYEALDGVLTELRTMTMDNRDAEAFLKPVGKTEAPDYYEVIQEPMDLGTMVKKVRNKVYKSKREFKDDLDRIWDNCFQYNAAENHPLRKCAARLRAKAEILLQNLTDRKERGDPVIPPELVYTPAKTNGVNGHGRSHTAHSRTPVPVARRHTPGASSRLAAGSSKRGGDPSKRGGNPEDFPNEPAVPRTVDGMSEFRRLDEQFAALDSAIEGKPGSSSAMAERLRELARGATPIPGLGLFAAMKRKLSEEADAETPPGKRPREGPTDQELYDQEQRELHDLWWQANQKSDLLLGNGLPPITYASSIPSRKPKKRRRPPAPPPATQNPKSLLSMMNNNIATLRRVRTVNAKLAALDGEGDPTPALSPEAEEARALASEQPWRVPTRGGGRRVGGLELGQENAAACMTWMTRKTLEHTGFQGASKNALDVLSDVAAGYLLNVGRTLRFLSDKFGKKMTPEEIILHTLFESGVSEVQDLERYIADDVERYGTRLADNETKLVRAYRDRVTAPDGIIVDEGLFDEDEDDEELDPLARGDLATFLGDDDDYLGLISSGIAADLGVASLTVPSRLMRGKRARPVVAAQAREQEEDNPHAPPPPFVPLDSNTVEEQIGLLRPFYEERIRGLRAPAAPVPAPAAVPALPGPPMRPPAPPAPVPPVAAPVPLPPPIAGSSSLPNTLPTSISMLPPPTARPDLPPLSPTHPVVLPDDPPSLAQTKIGPLGQVTRNAPPKKAEVAAAKRAEKAAKSGAGAGGAAGGGAGGEGGGAGKKRKSDGEDGPAPKKRKNMGIGSGNWKRKKPGEQGQAGQGQGQQAQQKQAMAYPAPVVAASA